MVAVVTVVTVVMVWWDELQYQLSSLDDLLSAPSWSSLPRHPDIIITLLPAVHQNHSPHLTTSSGPDWSEFLQSLICHSQVRGQVRSGQVRSASLGQRIRVILLCSHCVSLYLYNSCWHLTCWQCDNLTCFRKYCRQYELLPGWRWQEWRIDI